MNEIYLSNKIITIHPSGEYFIAIKKKKKIILAVIKLFLNVAELKVVGNMEMF